MPENQAQLAKNKAIIPLPRILELHAAGLNNQEIAQVLGCTRENVRQRLAAVRADFKGLRTFKDRRADLLAMFQQKLLYSLTEADIKKMPGGSRILAMCQLYDKERIERGKPGAIVEFQDIQAEIDQADQEIAALERELAEIEGGG
jgi:hypothetical protein